MMQTELPPAGGFPPEIRQLTVGLAYTVDAVGRSDDRVYLFGDRYVLKESLRRDRLLREKGEERGLAVHIQRQDIFDAINRI